MNVGFTALSVAIMGWSVNFGMTNPVEGSSIVAGVVALAAGGILYRALDGWNNDKKDGTVSNQGCGGCNMYYPNSLGEKLTAYAKTLPPVDVSYLYNDGKVHTMQEDADTLIDSIFEKHLLKKDCSKKTLFKIPSYAYKSKGEFHVMNVKFSADIKAELVKQYGKDVKILNEEFVKV